MTDLNDVKLIGRIVKDTILEKKEDLAYAKFSIAVNRDVKQKDGVYKPEPTFIDLAIFGTYAESMYKFLKKGTLVLVQGSLKMHKWTKDDENHSELGITVKNVQLLSSPKNKEKSEIDFEEPIVNENTFSINEVNSEPEDLSGIF